MNDIYDILNKFNSVAAPRERQQITEGIMEVAIEEMGGEPVTPKQKAFAKLAPPADKITFADKIAGAKKEVDEMLGDVAAEAMKKAVVGLKNEQGMEEAASNAPKMARIAKRCARDAFSNIDRKMFLKAAELFAAGDEARGLNTINRMDTEARDDFYMGCDDAGIQLPMDEGNDFTGARLAAIKAGKPTFSVGGKTFKVTGDTSDEKKMMEKKGKTEKTLWPGTPEYKAKFGDEMRTGEKKKSSTGGEIEKTATGVKHTRSYDDDDAEDTKADDGAPRKKGRPKGSKRALGAKGPTGKSKLLSKGSIREEGMEDEESVSIVDKGEYDREGDMAKEQLHTAADAARELHDILDSDENLPEWVQSKITKAMDYLDTARDYMKASDSEDEEEMAERKLTKPEMKKREEVVKSMKKSKGDFEKRYGERGEEVMYATATKMAKKKAEESTDEKDKEEVEETTTSGSVATAPAEAPKSKGKKGMVFGKGVYEGYETRFRQLLTEGMSMNASQNEDGTKTLSVTATDDDAVKLAQILKLAGMEQAGGYEEACPTCGADKGMCEHTQMEEGEYANSPEETGADINTLVNTYSDGLDGQKTTGQTTIPVIAGQTQRMMSQVQEQAEQRLWDLYKRYESK